MISGVAVYLIYRVVERLFLSSIAALLVAGFYLFSESMLYDNSILSDSIYAS
jgi:Gpi18-like mannosyltransferase